MTDSAKDKKKYFLAASASLMVLLSLAYLFVPREKLGDRSPLSVLTAPDKRVLFECVGAKPLNYKQREASSDLMKRLFSGTLSFDELREVNSSKTGCLKYSGVWQKRKTLTGSVAKGGLGWSDVGNLITKDLPAIGGLFLLIGASPAIAFFVFRSLISGRASGALTSSKTSALAAVGLSSRPQVSGSPNPEIGERLQKLQSLHQRGLISAAELDSRRKQLLDEI